jgi:hypothetical protein
MRNTSRPRSVLRPPFVLLLALAAAGAVAACAVDESEPDPVDETALAAGVQCTSDCHCEFGFYCGAGGACEPDFSPPGCFADCQCDYGEACVGGNCLVPQGPCQSDCDCPISHICNVGSGACEPDFGPYPYCRADCHCEGGDVCEDGFCRPDEGGGIVR